MSLVLQGRGASCGALGGFGVVGRQYLGGPGSPLRVLRAFPFTTSSLLCSDPPSQLQSQFHQGAGFVRLSEERGHRDRASFTRILQSPLCHSQSHRGLVTSHRSLTAQRLGGALQVSHGDCSVRSPISVREIGWCPWISRMPTSRFRFIQLLAVT